MVVIADCHKIKFYIHRMLLHYSLSGPLYDSFENASVFCVTTFIALQYSSIAGQFSISSLLCIIPLTLHKFDVYAFWNVPKRFKNCLVFFFIAYCIIFKGEKSIEQNEKQTKRIYLFLYSKSMVDFEAFC